MRYLIVMLFMLLSAEVLAQATPAGYTTNIGIRKYNAGDDASADSMNANSDDIDSYAGATRDTLDLVKADLYNVVDYSGNLKVAVVTVASLSTAIDTSHVKTTGTDVIYGTRTFSGTVQLAASSTISATVTVINGGKIGFTGTGKLKLPVSIISDEQGSIRYLAATRALVVYTHDFAGTTDTVASYDYVRSNFVPSTGGTFSGTVHQGFETFPIASGTVTLSGGSNHYEITLPVASQTVTSFTVTDQAQGDIIMLINTAGANTLTLNDASPFNLTGAFVMSEDDNIMLYYDGTLWVELSRSNN